MKAYKLGGFAAALCLLGSAGCACWGSGSPQPADAGQQGYFCGPRRSDTWVLIDTKSKVLTVFKGGAVADIFSGVALGAANSGQKRKRGDDVTPLGNYRIVDIRPSEKFKIFMELDYPSTGDAKRALDEGRISKNLYKLVQQAHERGMRPPQNTVLGGNIGIHGLGRGSKEIHQNINWTAGCLALDNEQIVKLADLLRPGVVVEIR